MSCEAIVSKIVLAIRSCKFITIYGLNANVNLNNSIEKYSIILPKTETLVNSNDKYNKNCVKEFKIDNYKNTELHFGAKTYTHIKIDMEQIYEGYGLSLFWANVYGIPLK